ncbi:four-carbon acid sugar kinase family protein [Kribbella sp. NPDC048928]|uniref:four-carbon acid sugar kinase family protein n=1 Tax=Kribbella sp. NPDC048928 TaxID=3364111 RepID=UPI0037142FEA
MTALVIHADDLTGAAETAALFRHVSPDGTVLQLHSGTPGGGLTVIDLDTRHLSADEAERRTRTALATTGVPLFTKLDSMLRGNYTAHLRALDPTEHPVVLTPALPAAGRCVVNGRLLLRDRAPLNVLDVLAELPTYPIPPAGGELRPGIAVADASTDGDLDRLVEATWQVPNIRYVGAGGLAAALARRLTTQQASTHTPLEATGVLYVVGTAEPVAQHQLQALRELTDVETATISPADTSAVEGARLAQVLADRGTVALQAPAIPHDPTLVANALAAAAHQILAKSNVRPALVLTGGHTARTVLEALGIDHLTVVDEIHHGAVLSHTRDGRPVVTRPGSFGDRSSFAAIHAVLRPYSVRKATTS